MAFFAKRNPLELVSWSEFRDSILLA